MKAGDLVKLSSAHGKSKPALVIDLIEKKCWRTEVNGPRVNWDIIEPEPHAVVSINNSTLTIPITDLSLVNEAG